MSYIGTSPREDVTINKKEYTATEGQTSFGVMYDTYVEVYLNGIRLSKDTDFVATNGVEIVLNSGAAEGDLVNCSGYQDLSFISADTFPYEGTLDATTVGGAITELQEDISEKVDKIDITGSTVGSGTEIPVITYNDQGQITSTSTTSVAGIDSVTFTGGDLTIQTGDGSDYTTDLDGRYFTETESDGRFVNQSSNQALATDSNVLYAESNILKLKRANGDTDEVNLSLYLDDTNLSKITSGSVDGNGLATFTRDDASTFTVDFSVLFDDTNLSRITSASFNSSTGVITLTRNDSSVAGTVDIDGRYLPLSGGTITGNIAVSGTVDGRNVSADGTKLDGIAVNANNYSHPSTHPATMITTTDEFAYSNSSNVQDVLDDLDQAIANVNGKDPVITLTGDVSGSGTMTNLGNVSISATVGNDSHSHSNYVLKAGDTMTGDLSFGTQMGTWIASDVMNDAIGWNSSHGVYIGSTVGGTHYLRANGTFTTGGSTYSLFHDNYHPNADKWTTSRTLSLTGDVSGSTTWDGSGNASINVNVGDADTVDGKHASELGPTGGGNDKIFSLNDQVVTTSYSIPSGQNAMTAGSITINNGVTITISDGSSWTIV